MYVKLGNENAVHRPHNVQGTDGVMTSAGGPIAASEKLDGPRVTYVPVNEDASLLDIFQDITKPAGIWHAHSDLSRDENGNIVCAPPTWVETDVPGLAELLKAQYGCDAGAPDDLEETHHTDAGPPGVGPDGPIAGTPGGDEALARDREHADWEAQRISELESSDAPDAAAQAAARRESAQARGFLGRGFGGMLLFTFALAFFALSRAMLRVDAGKDFQSKVMGDTASTGTGSYASATYIGLTENVSAPAAGDTTLTGELTASGLGRAQATYAHTAGAASYTETKTFTSSDVTTRTVHKAALFNAASTGTMPFESALPSDAILVSGDTLTVTWTISI